MRQGSNLTTFGRGLDADTDGQSDANEYLAGTNPLDANDFLSLHLLLAGNSAAPVLEWSARSSYLYFIDQRDNLSASATWQPFAPEPIIGTGENTIVALPSSATSKFYRIRAYPPLSSPNR